MTINDLIANVTAEIMTVNQAIDIIEREKMTYAIEYFSPQDATEHAYWPMLAEWQRRQDIKRQNAAKLPAAPQPEPEMKKCACGHTIPRDLVMSASMGSSCPRCYDRMSN